MASLAQLPELVGFFSYSREDDDAFKGSLSALRDAVGRELAAQLGRTKRNFRLWQDLEAIAPGKMWEAEIAKAIEQAVFFIPIITPRAVASEYCQFEFNSFLAREQALGRADLVFPILFITVPGLQDEAKWRNDPVLSVVSKRQYVDWRRFRHVSTDTTAFGEAIESFCGKIAETLCEPWISPEERLRQEAEALKRAEDEERVRQEAERRKRAEEDERRRREEDQTQRRLGEEAERHRREIEAKTREGEPHRKVVEQARGEVEARRQAEREVRQLAGAGGQETRPQSSRPWRPSRRDMTIAGVVIATMAASAVAWWSRERLKEETHPQTIAATPAPAREKAESQAPATAAAPAPAREKAESLAPATAAAPAPAREKAESQAPATAAAPAPAQERAPEPAPQRALKADSFNAAESLKDCDDCPDMIVVPAGRFLMGSPTGQGNDDERPQHEVTIAKPFAVAKFAVTFDEWDACAAHGGCRRDVSDEGSGRGRRPALNVSWDDAQTYVKWLSGITGKEYRLLSEAEYEYAARAGTQTKYPWGDKIKVDGKAMATCFDCGSKWDKKNVPAPVGSFPANRFGLYDMVGVWSWTEDCWHDDYNGAPADGSPWTSGNRSVRVARGGALLDLRSAIRLESAASNESHLLGFRVARTLTP